MSAAPADDARLDELVAAVRAGAGYRTIDEGLVRRIGRRELAVRRTMKEAVKETRSRLHQVAGAFLDDRPNYVAWLAELRAAEPHDPRDPDGPFAVACTRIMRRHASTRERLPIIAALYAQIFAQLPPVHTLLDLACGLNPLAFPWMQLAPGATYYACDIYADMVAFVGSALEIAGVDGRALVHDLAVGAPDVRADLALALKILPTLDQIERGAGLRLLQTIDAPQIVVSFPARSLGGRNKGMAANYAREFRALVEGEGWDATQFNFVEELVFLVVKP